MKLKVKQVHHPSLKINKVLNHQVHSLKALKTFFNFPHCKFSHIIVIIVNIITTINKCSSLYSFKTFKSSSSAASHFRVFSLRGKKHNLIGGSTATHVHIQCVSGAYSMKIAINCSVIFFREIFNSEVLR